MKMVAFLSLSILGIFMIAGGILLLNSDISSSSTVVFVAEEIVNGIALIILGFAHPLVNPWNDDGKKAFVIFSKHPE